VPVLQRLVERLKSVSRRGIHRFRAKRAVRAGLFRGIDFEQMTAIRKNYDAHPFTKYHDKFQHSLIRNAERIFALGLDQSSGLRILDIGCGFGYFMYAARQFGHRPIGLDQDDPYFNEVTGLLGLRKVLHTIAPYQPLPEIPDGPFDLITAFATCFDRAGEEGQWGPKEWAFFVRDLTRFMAPSCLLHIKFNQYVGTAHPRSFECRPVPDDLLEYFQSMGATFDKRAMQIPNVRLQVAAR
jgi:cyclopropane fatty-acyl-phospholipid synthase-like methyltransferase